MARIRIVTAVVISQGKSILFFDAFFKLISTAKVCYLLLLDVSPSR